MLPNAWWWLSLLSISGIMWLWLRSACTPWAAAGLGLVFGLAFDAVSTSWLPGALRLYPDAPRWITIGAAPFAWAYCSIPWLLAGGAQALCYRYGPRWRLLVAAPLGALLGWWINTWALGGMPWTAPAYVFLDTMFAGFFPVGGYLLANLAVLWMAGCAVLAWHEHPRWILGALSVPLLGWTLQQIMWTHPAATAVKVGIVQTRAPLGFAQSNDALQSLQLMNLRISKVLVERDHVDVVIWPEAGFQGSALEWRTALSRGLKPEFAKTAFVIGMLIDDLEPGKTSEVAAPLYNVALAGGLHSSGLYAKRHLLPFGEFWPQSLPSVWRSTERAQRDVTAGPDRQAPMMVRGQPVAASICYDDVYAVPFGDTDPSPSWLVNLSNDAWFDGDMPFQHLGMSRARAMELGRYMVRAANVGPSAIIAPNGKVLAQTQRDQTSMLSGSITPLQGLTPFARWGNAVVMALWGLLACALALRFCRRAI